MSFLAVTMSININYSTVVIYFSDLSENNLRKDYLEHGSVYAHGRDIDGRSLLVFNTKKHVKGQKDLDEIKKCVVYWMERLQR